MAFESLSAKLRLVRPGAAVETRPEALRYRGFKRALEKCEFGWYRGRFAFRPKVWGERLFVVLGGKTDGEKTLDPA